MSSADKVELRPELRAFARAMEVTLRKNDRKGGWKECHPLWLATKLQEEMGEVARELVELSYSSGEMGPVTPATIERLQRTLAECVDVACVAMMLFDQLQHPAIWRTLGKEEDNEPA